jgi:hypothetical protein
MSPTASKPPFSADNPRMPLCRPLPSRGNRVLVRLLCVLSVLILTACGAAAPRSTDTTAIWAGRPIGQPPSPNARLKAAMVQRAVREWHQFDRQVVLFDGADESIPHVGAWEDDYTHSGRVNLYWRAVNKPDLVGMDCRQPWSAAFISWVMQSAGVPASQFRAAPAHWIYLSSMIEEASYPGRFFVPRRVQDYSPNPGDLICASRGQYPIRSNNGYTSALQIEGAETHCDLVVAKQGRSLEVIGGNVRNSVSKSILELDARGRLQPVPRRPWFLIIETRL